MADSRGRGDTIDVEELAVLAGIKPAMRATQRDEDIPALTARLGKRGLVARIAKTTQRYVETGDRGWRPVYIAKTDAAAERLEVAEASERVKGTVALGLALGYPACCVDAFMRRLARVDAAARPHWHRFLRPVLRRLHRPGPELRDLELAALPGGAEDYIVAREAWCAAPDARLNNLLFRLRARLISHAPCRYDCRPSIEYADAVAAAIAKERPAALARIKSLVARPVLVAPSTARVVATVEGGRIVRAEALAEPNAPEGTESMLELDRELARVAESRTVGRYGLVELPRTWPPAVLLAFTWPE